MSGDRHGNGDGGPPRWARGLLERLARPAYAEEVLGDLEETQWGSVSRRVRGSSSS
jgi:hypothetical protein